MKAWLIEKLGGYPDIDSAIEAIRDKDHKEREKILTLAVKKLFNTIGPDDILRENENHEWIVAGKTIRKDEKTLLMAEAKAFQESKLWKAMQDDVKYQANRKMFILSTEIHDLSMGKSWLYVLDAFKTRIVSITAGSGHLNGK